MDISYRNGYYILFFIILGKLHHTLLRWELNMNKILANGYAIIEVGILEIMQKHFHSIFVK